jgi:hypothetical protein
VPTYVVTATSPNQCRGCAFLRNWRAHNREYLQDHPDYLAEQWMLCDAELAHAEQGCTP